MGKEQVTKNNAPQNTPQDLPANPDLANSSSCIVEMNTGHRLALATFLSQSFQNVSIQKGFLVLNLRNKLLLNADEAKVANLREVQGGGMLFDPTVMWKIEFKEAEVELMLEAIKDAIGEESEKEFPLAIVESILFIQNEFAKRIN